MREFNTKCQRGLNSELILIHTSDLHHGLVHLQLRGGTSRRQRTVHRGSMLVSDSGRVSSELFIAAPSGLRGLLFLLVTIDPVNESQKVFLCLQYLLMHVYKKGV